MARPSKLTQRDWDKIRDRIDAGEPLRQVGADFGISPAAISRRFATVSKQTQQIATQLAAAHTALETLPKAEQYRAMSLAEKIRGMAESLTHAGELGAKNAHRLMAMANEEVQKLDMGGDGVEMGSALKGVAALTAVANESGKIALGMLQGAGKGALPSVGDDVIEDVPKTAALAIEALRKNGS